LARRSIFFSEVAVATSSPSLTPHLAAKTTLIFSAMQRRRNRVMQDRKAFDELKKGTSKAADLPYIGLFNDGEFDSLKGT
jgi:hypothetical protein